MILRTWGNTTLDFACLITLVTLTSTGCHPVCSHVSDYPYWQQDIAYPRTWNRAPMWLESNTILSFVVYRDRSWGWHHNGVPRSQLTQIHCFFGWCSLVRIQYSAFTTRRNASWDPIAYTGSGMRRIRSIASKRVKTQIDDRSAAEKLSQKKTRLFFATPSSGWVSKQLVPCYRQGCCYASL